MLFGISFFNFEIYKDYHERIASSIYNHRHNNERNNQKHSYFYVITNASENLQSLQSQNKLKSLDCLGLK